MDTKPVVIDNGGCMIKAGFAGEYAPRSVFPSFVGEPRNKGVVLAAGDKEYFVGYQAQEKRGCLSVHRPIQNSQVEDWKDVERLWCHTFYSELKIVPEDHPIIMSEPPLNPADKREKTTEIMFERFAVPGFYLGVGSVFSLYSQGQTTGLVVDSGVESTVTVPIFEGYTLTRHICKTSIAGQSVTDYLVKLLKEKGYGFTTANEIDIVNYIKESSCYIAPNYDEAVAGATASNANVLKYPLPDGQDILLNQERFQAPQLMFDPSLMPGAAEEGAQGLDVMCFESIGKCDAEIRKELYKYIALSGGNTMFEGLGKRIAYGMHQQYKVRFPNESIVQIKVVDDASRMYSTWLGGSMLGVLHMFPKMWITKEEYEEHGPAVVHTKCF
eukprot:NODE_1658_length_1262_cov_117.588546_g1643_i0.p1 GENE.NODE_1658_length_1262_cov_117.588546_g1643_i0~~NODE_1658_length_1262_cov_117.588546_g1643_i0.p1  ORF type:complete len:384 (+),score=45.20 NODE_1658_length_1262_cov_117.588546_g1643_i0:87-1238(+)